MKRNRRLTTAEIHLLAVLLTGELNEEKNVIIVRLSKSTLSCAHDVAMTVTGAAWWYHLNNASEVKRSAINYLLSLGLIYLKPCTDTPLRARIDGIWTINKKVFKTHPQYNEVRAHAALGT